MPWKKQFNVDDALDRAKNTFWTVGYEATSMTDLLKSMGINRGSFYDTFKSKHDVMLAVLRRYDTNNRKALLAALPQGRTPRETLVTMFRAAIDPSRDPNVCQGCFLVNSALELSPSDPEVAEIVRNAFADNQRFFREQIEASQELGEISNDVDPETLASLLTTQNVGLMVLVRAGSPQSVLDAAVEQIEKLLS
jgi:TetR/AcrR family transcriptional repressor of nem operon